MNPFASLAGHRLQRLNLYVPNVGAWFADCVLDESTDLPTGQITLAFGSLKLNGTAAPQFSGDFVGSRTARIVGGAGAWGRAVAAKGYHNDAGVKAKLVCEDAAREVGETLGGFVPSVDVIGIDYARRTGPAVHVLEDALGDTPWWVDYAGVTQVGERPATAPKAGSYELLQFDPLTRLATLSLDDPAAIGIGAVLTDRLSAPQTIRELEFEMTAGSLRVTAWCGGDAKTPSRLMRVLAALVARTLGGKLFGKYRYRVVTMAVDGRANLQAVTKAKGLPDMLPVSARPGVAGWWADLTLGGEVLVEFIAGDPTDPIVTGFPGKGEPGFVPVSLAFGNGVAAVARVGDLVKAFLPPALPVAGTVVIGGTPSAFSGVITVTTPMIGLIQTGRPELRA